MYFFGVKSNCYLLKIERIQELCLNRNKNGRENEKWLVTYLATDFLGLSCSVSRAVSTLLRFSLYPDDLDRDLDSLWRRLDRGIYKRAQKKHQINLVKKWLFALSMTLNLSIFECVTFDFFFFLCSSKVDTIGVVKNEQMCSQML